MNLKPQDVVVLLKLVAQGSPSSFANLASQLSMSASEVHAGMRRSTESGLLDPVSKMPIRAALQEFIIHGLRYVYPPQRGSMSRGIPTGYAAPTLAQHFPQPATELPPVWPDPEGSAKGYALLPLYPSVPKAVRQDPGLYELLALVDAIREGRTRERALAGEQLKVLLNKR